MDAARVELSNLVVARLTIRELTAASANAGQYLWKAAWCLHDKAGPDIAAFVARHARTILAGNSEQTEQTVADLRHAAKTAALPEDKLATIGKTRTYLENKRPWLHHDIALAHDWPTATGIIEGTCRHLVKDRLDNTGTRWTPTSAEAVPKLRTPISNSDFDAYRAFHLRAEHQPIHQARHQHQHNLTTRTRPPHNPNHTQRQQHPRSAPESFQTTANGARAAEAVSRLRHRKPRLP